MKKIVYFIVPVLFLFVCSCSRADETTNIEKIVIKNDNNAKSSYAFFKQKRLYDGEFFVDYLIEANSQAEIDEILKLDPKIKVELVDSRVLGLYQRLNTDVAVYEQKKDPQKVDIQESIINSNIPKGYQVSFRYNNSSAFGAKTVDSVARGSYATRSFADSGAKGIYVQQNGYQLTCTFYSKGCWSCWNGWKDRGYRTIGPNHTYSHTFHTTNYTEDAGAKMEAYTTLDAWNATIKNFIY